VSAGMVAHSPVGFSEWGRQLDEWRAQGLGLWAAIERPEGRVVDVLLDHGVRVYPVNPPKAGDRARDRFRQSGAKDDLFDARVLAGFLRSGPSTASPRCGGTQLSGSSRSSRRPVPPSFPRMPEDATVGGGPNFIDQALTRSH